jgi:dTDP-4-amino-4,6-dideoxygalactose transaminase
MTTLSFHPVKHITTAEGGMVLTNRRELAERLRLFRSHGIVRDPERFERPCAGPWDNDMIELGYNYRLPDLCCALGTSQLKRIDAFVSRRRGIASLYRELLSDAPEIQLPPGHPGHSYHLFVIRVNPGIRRPVFEFLRESGIGAQVHYVPLHLHSYYRKNFGAREGGFPVAEECSKRAISLPIYNTLSDDGARYVAGKLREAVARAL